MEVEGRGYLGVGIVDGGDGMIFGRFKSGVVALGSGISNGVNSSRRTLEMSRRRKGRPSLFLKTN